VYVVVCRRTSWGTVGSSHKSHTTTTWATPPHTPRRKRYERTFFINGRQELEVLLVLGAQHEERHGFPYAASLTNQPPTPTTAAANTSSSKVHVAKSVLQKFTTLDLGQVLSFGSLWAEVRGAIVLSSQKPSVLRQRGWWRALAPLLAMSHTIGSTTWRNIRALPCPRVIMSCGVRGQECRVHTSYHVCQPHVGAAPPLNLALGRLSFCLCSGHL
jgi:hypothetical protein